MAKLSYGPNVLISLGLLLLGVCAWIVLVSSLNCLQCCVINSGRRLLPSRVLDIQPAAFFANRQICFLQLGGAAALQKNGDVIAPLLTANAATVVTGDLTPTSIARRFISYEWFKYVLSVCCSLLSAVSGSHPLTRSCIEVPVSTVSNGFASPMPFTCRAVLQIVVLLFAIAMLAAGQFHRFRLAIVGLLAVCTVLFCDACHTFYYCKSLLPVHLPCLHYGPCPTASVLV